MATKQEILICDGFKVEITEMNHTLYIFREGGHKVTVGKHKDTVAKDKWEEAGHFPNMIQVLRRVIESKLIDDDTIDDIQSYIDKLEELNNQFLKWKPSDD